MKKRNLFVTFLLIGWFRILYLIIWMISIQNFLKRTKKSSIGGGITLLLMIITIGLYSFIWQWKTCKSLKSLGAQDNSVVTLILLILVIGIIINPLIIQSSINNIKNFQQISF